MIVDNGKYYLYRHIRLDKNEPFYIGIGTKPKKRDKYYRAHSTKGRNVIWDGIYKRGGLLVEILLESNDANFIMTKEREFIKLYGRICNKSGILSNMQEGGFVDRGKNRKMSFDRINHSVNLCLENAKKATGKNHFYKLARGGFAYDISGNYLFSFRSGIEAEKIIGNGAKSYNIIRKIDTRCSYKDLFFSSVKKDRIDVSGFRVEPHGRDYSPKAVVQLDKDGSIIREFNTIKDAAAFIGIHKDALSSNLRLNRKTKAGIFKYKKDIK